MVILIADSINIISNVVSSAFLLFVICFGFCGRLDVCSLNAIVTVRNWSCNKKNNKKNNNERQQEEQLATTTPTCGCHPRKK